MFKDKVESLLQDALGENKSLFLIDLSIQGNNEIKVVIDGDHGVTVADCVEVSRKVEHNLDRDETDFSIEVMSAGATAPLINKRQYTKNVGRTLEVDRRDGQSLEGELLETGQESIKIGWKSREPKTVGKGKTTVHNEAVIKYEEIAQAKVKIKF